MPQTTDRHEQRRVRPVVVRDRRGSGMRRMRGAVSADARMFRAISADVAHAADPRQLARRPPTLSSCVTPSTSRARSPRCASWPTSGSAPMSAGWRTCRRAGRCCSSPTTRRILIVDTFIFAQAFYDHFGSERELFHLAHDLVFKVPGIRAMLTPYGTVPASPENMRRALARRAAPRCSFIRAATTRPTGPVGTPPRSTSPTGPASCGSR